jgi:predicted Zn-dependent peptidase
MLGYLLTALAFTAFAQESGKSEDKRITSFTLPNGLRFVLMERHQSPVISFSTYVGGGSVDDPTGQTGLSNLVGRLVFKGAETIGSRNWPEEKKALDAADDLYDRMEAERNKGLRMKEETFDTLRSQWRLAVDAAQRLGDGSEYSRILQENGVTGASVSAKWNCLQSGFSLPSNRLELWFAMESQRLMRPVLRDFEKERATMLEEQAKNQANPQARVGDALLAAAFIAHPYRVPAGGWPSDSAELKRREAVALIEKRFVPGNIVVAMAGDLDPSEVKRLAEKYLGPMPVRPLPPISHAVEPAQMGPRTVELVVSGPILTAVGFKRPSYYDKDDGVLDVLQFLLNNGNGGMAVREIVQEKKVAAGLQVFATYPDGHYPSLFLFLGSAPAGQPVEQIHKAIEELLARLRIQKVGEDALAEAKAQAQSRAYQRLESNSTLAEMLAVYAAAYNDPSKLFTSIEDLNKVTEDDIQRVAQRYLIPSNRTTVFTSIPGMTSRSSLTGGPQ